MQKWRMFERLVARLITDEYDPEHYTVIPNARISGHISQRSRQIDVLIDYRYSSLLHQRVIIDAKDRNRPVDIKDVESFEGLMKDVSAHRGFLICSNGHTKAAKRRAQDHIGIRLISSNEIESFDLKSWDPCNDDRCGEGLVLWDATPGIFYNDAVTVQATGKCDKCGQFQIWCWGCGHKTAIGKEDEWQCPCKGPWFWLTSIEPENEEGYFQGSAHYLLLILGNGTWEVIDRRPI